MLTASYVSQGLDVGDQVIITPLPGLVSGVRVKVAAP